MSYKEFLAQVMFLACNSAPLQQKKEIEKEIKKERSLLSKTNENSKKLTFSESINKKKNKSHDEIVSLIIAQEEKTVEKSLKSRLLNPWLITSLTALLIGFIASKNETVKEFFYSFFKSQLPNKIFEPGLDEAQSLAEMRLKELTQKLIETSPNQNPADLKPSYLKNEIFKAGYYACVQETKCNIFSKQFAPNSTNSSNETQPQENQNDAKDS